MEAKKWHLFAGDHYYPSAYLGDYRGSFATFEDAADAAHEQHEDHDVYGDQPKYAWACVAKTHHDGTLTLYWVRGS